MQSRTAKKIVPFIGKKKEAERDEHSSPGNYIVTSSSFNREKKRRKLSTVQGKNMKKSNKVIVYMVDSNLVMPVHPPLLHSVEKAAAWNQWPSLRIICWVHEQSRRFDMMAFDSFMIGRKRQTSREKERKNARASENGASDLIIITIIIVCLKPNHLINCIPNQIDSHFRAT